PSLSLDMFAYDLNEPDLMAELIKLAAQGRIRVILDDDPKQHHLVPKAVAAAAASAAKKKTKAPAEGQFEKKFHQAATRAAEIKRGHFDRYAHDKILIVKKGTKPTDAVRVLTGSTNFSVTGLYVNSNHVITFEDAGIAVEYAKLFDEAWKDDVQAA